MSQLDLISTELSSTISTTNSAYYHRMVESLPDGLVVHNKQEIFYINNAGAKLLKAADPE